MGRKRQGIKAAKDSIKRHIFLFAASMHLQLLSTAGGTMIGQEQWWSRLDNRCGNRYRDRVERNDDGGRQRREGRWDTKLATA